MKMDYLIRTSEEVDPGQMYQAFRDNDHTEVIERYIVNTQIFAKRFPRSLWPFNDYSEANWG